MKYTMKAFHLLQDLMAEDFTEKLCSNLDSNCFSTVDHDKLPVPPTHIARAAWRSPREIFKESLGFCIMSGNSKLLCSLLNSSVKLPDDPEFYPFHLAISYLDGSRGCCSILDTLVIFLPPSRFYVNALGHTMLDQLMINIIKSHTSCLPEVVDEALKSTKRFEDQEVDICGRWDADSNCIRALAASRSAIIPVDWKHVFCHTSIQAICHCMGSIFGSAPDIDWPSGLFVKRCMHCGCKLQLLPLHCLLMTAYYLSTFGCENESLFGVVACLLCLLSYGSNPTLKADISTSTLFNEEDPIDCDHKSIGPCELLEQIRSRFESSWPLEIRHGWEILHQILKLSQAERGANQSVDRFEDEECSVHDFDEIPDNNWAGSSPDTDSNSSMTFPHECPDNDWHKRFFGDSQLLATLWAAVQTELLTYRRLEEGDPWISQNFNMSDLNASLQRDGDIDVLLVKRNMMKPFCLRGRWDTSAPDLPIVDEVTTCYFSNLDDWKRSSFISSRYRLDNDL